MIRVENVSFSYNAESENPVPALHDVSLEVGEGEFIAIVGHNGSGKSTLAKHLNALLTPTSGQVWVKGMNTRDRQVQWQIRQTVGMVFQNPDNQLIATVVEDDLAFGPENLGLPPAEIRKRIDDVVDLLKLRPFLEKGPHLLSGGQKQRVAIAGVLAMQPECIVLDEPTALLDPIGREEVYHFIERLNREEGVAVVLITHFMHEATRADRVLVMDRGRVVMSGTPREVFADADKIRSLALDVPLVTQVALRLNALGYDVPKNVLSVEELVEGLCSLRSRT